MAANDRHPADPPLNVVVEEVGAAGKTGAQGPPLPPFARRGGPMLVVTLLKVLGATSVVMAVVVGVGAVVLAARHGTGGTLWAGVLGGVLALFLGLVLALGLLALARLLERVDQAVRRLADLAVPRPTASASADPATEAVGILREIREAVRLTDEQKTALVREAEEGQVQALVATIERRLAERDFVGARGALAELAERHPGAGVAADLVRRVDEAEAAGRQALAAELVENIRACLAAQAFDQACALAAGFLRDFPEDPRARDLSEEARRRRDEATAAQRQASYERITGLARDQRWAEALDAANALLEQFPESDEAAKLRPRLVVLRKKAGDTECRRLLAEVRQRSFEHRWREAYAAALDLVNSHPDSAEAAEVFNSLPRLRRLADGAAPRQG